MKIYEKPMATINKFEVEDIMAASQATIDVAKDTAFEDFVADGSTVQGIAFQW